MQLLWSSCYTMCYNTCYKPVLTCNSCLCATDWMLRMFLNVRNLARLASSLDVNTFWCLMSYVFVNPVSLIYLCVCTNLLNVYDLLSLNFDGMSRCKYKRLKCDWMMFMLFSHLKLWLLKISTFLLSKVTCVW